MSGRYLKEILLGLVLSFSSDLNRDKVRSYSWTTWATKNCWQKTWDKRFLVNRHHCNNDITNYIVPVRERCETVSSSFMRFARMTSSRLRLILGAAVLICMPFFRSADGGNFDMRLLLSSKHEQANFFKYLHQKVKCFSCIKIYQFLLTSFGMCNIFWKKVS